MSIKQVQPAAQHTWRRRRQPCAITEAEVVAGGALHRAARGKLHLWCLC